MRVKIRILDAAAQDLIDGFRFYEIQEVGLGQYFLDSLFADIDSLLLNAGIHPLCFGTYHRLLAKRFPFAIYYKVEGEQVSVYAILDCRRNPAWNRKRLRKSET
jgi:plasmid stabilization system protein ParE